MADGIEPLERLADMFRRLGGVGKKTAARYAYCVLNLSDEEAAQAYLSAYTAEYGDDGKITVQDGSAAAADEAVYQKAMEFWSQGVCRVDIVLRNGLQLRNCLYSPVPKLFTVYGVYRFDEPFF